MGWREGGTQRKGRGVSVSYMLTAGVGIEGIIGQYRLYHIDGPIILNLETFLHLFFSTFVSLS